MCLILFAHNAHPDYPLVVAANRDEFYARPTEAAHFWPEHPQLLAGKDLQAGGTWMGITREGRFAAITNFREGEQSEAAHSRGKLTLDFLLGQQLAEHYLAELAPKANLYNGFNLLIGSPGELHYLSNRDGPAEKLPDGIYALSNGTLMADWEKIHRGKEDLELLLSSEPNEAALQNLMLDTQQSAPQNLPNTGVSTKMEQLLSSRFIQSEHYGTRAVTSLIVSGSGETQFCEQNYDNRGKVGGPVRHCFSL